MDRKSASQGIIDYHDRTKHYPNKYARSPGYLDWKNEPDPFRRYEGTTPIPLPLLKQDRGSQGFSLYARTKNIFQPFSFQNIASFLELSLGLSAWKSFPGTSWALRVNPSSGNLHPTEAYLILSPFPETGSRGGVFHYNPYLHALEPRARFDDTFWSPVREHFGMDGFLIGLSSIYWRESWKYGERAFRYCNHDVGHAVACLSFSANLLGWNVTYLNALSDSNLETLLGFDRTAWKEHEREHPDLLLLVHEHADKDVRRDIPEEIVRSFEELPFEGEPNRLSEGHVDWSIIDEVSSISMKPKTPERQYHAGRHGCGEEEIPSAQAAHIIRQRRSAQAYDGRTAIPCERFLSMLDKTVPGDSCAPFDVEIGGILVHLLLFVHRVKGLDPGIYFFFRDEREMSHLKKRCHSHFLWKRVDGAPEHLPLYLLEEGDCTKVATLVSCHQDIAGEGAFSVGMIAKFREIVEAEPYRYRHLFWETGMVGQVLYLEAEAHGVRGTGIGCFFDDIVHELLGFSDNTYQSLYHFTVGNAIEDTRLTTLPPYYHLEK